MPKVTRKGKSVERPKKPWEQGIVFAASSGMDMTQMTAKQRAAEVTNREKDPVTGKSLKAVKGAEVLHKEKDELGRSVQGVKNAERTNAVKQKVKAQEVARAEVARLNAQGSLISMDQQELAIAPDPRKSKQVKSSGGGGSGSGTQS